MWIELRPTKIEVIIGPFYAYRQNVKYILPAKMLLFGDYCLSIKSVIIREGRKSQWPPGRAPTCLL